MLALMKTLHTDKTTDIILTVPRDKVPAVTEAITGLFRLAGHEVCPPGDEDDDERRYTVMEAFPDFSTADVLHGARLTFELTQAELAEKLGIKQNHVSDMETGKRPISRKMAVKLGEIFNISPRAFLELPE
jgi:DNA-binding XRE family transcriptional regulator